MMTENGGVVEVRYEKTSATVYLYLYTAFLSPGGIGDVVREPRKPVQESKNRKRLIISISAL